jgi:protein ImuA
MMNKRDLVSRFSLARHSSPLIKRRFDSDLNGGDMARVLAVLTPAGTHEFYAENAADAVTVNGFGLGMALSITPGQGFLWAVHDRGAGENGHPYGAGLHEMGLSPNEVLLVRARDIRTLLGVGEDALRTRGIGVVLLSAWGEDRALSLTASRRLSLAARNGGKQLFLARAGAAPQPSAAESRWSIKSAASTPLEGGAPGRPAFSAKLLRHRGSAAVVASLMEWDREGRSFVEPATLSGRVVPLASQRQATTESLRRHA